MQNHKENLFSEKFHLLNSQEHVGDIKWSSSESSDVENISRNGKCSSVNKKVQRKRKRKKTGPKNISNLSIKILDTSKELNDVNSGQISPILRRKNEAKVHPKSPTFAPTLTYSRPHKCLKVQSNSPVLACKVPTIKSKVNILEKSPILYLKHDSPKVSPKIKRKLFKEKVVKECVQDNTNSLLDKRKPEYFISLNPCKITPPELQEIYQTQKLNTDTKDSLNELYKKSESSPSQPFLSTQNSEKNIADVKIEVDIPESQEEMLKTSLQNLDDTFTILKTSSAERAKRAKSYFENYFCSGNTPQSQHSISDCTTQKNSKSSDDVEIISILTQINSNRVSFQSNYGVVSKNPSPLSSQSAEYNTERCKKIRHKKDGLAFRLNALLKKQNASVSLWQHERFLADNSNFLIPKGEHVVFLIQRVIIKFGCFLLEGIDVNDSNVLVLISSIYVQDSNITENMVFKLYETYKTFNYKEDCKLIVNVCKFECKMF